RKINSEINAAVTRLKDVPASEVQIIEYTQKYGNPKFVVEGDILDASIREVRGGYKIYEALLFDENDSLIIKTFLNVNSSQDENFYMNHGFKGHRVRVFGYLEYDRYAGDVTLKIREMLGLGKSEVKRRVDLAPRRRVELHAHTKMSTQDGVMDIADYVNTALEFQHRALAVCDHYNIQALPDLDTLTQNTDLKPIFGLEGVMVDENKFRIALTDHDINLDDTVYVVYDLETTGLSSNYNEIIEIAAVKIYNGEIIDEFSTYVKPKRSIPLEITEITSITEDDVRMAPAIDGVIGLFKNFIEGAILVAHNAIFDNSYLYKNLRDYNLFIDEYPSIDTLQLAKVRYGSKLKTFNLKSVAKYFDVELTQHHRAIYDAKTTAEVFMRMLKELRSAGINNYSQLNSLIVEEEAYAHAFPTHITILAKNRTGIKNLNKIISASHTVHFYGEPRIPKKYLAKHREGLLIGSACGAGEIFNLALRDDYNKLLQAVDFYDYLEVQPIDSYLYMLDTGDGAYDESCIKDAIKKIIKAGKTKGKTVVATGDVHILNKEDLKFREIFINTPQVGGGLHPLYNVKRIPSQHFRSTDEMHKEFAFLGAELAEEIVIINSNLIADLIERFTLFPDRLFAPSDDSLKERGIPSMKQAVIELTYRKAQELYGKDLPPYIADRIQKELTSINNNNFASIYYISHLLVQHSKDAGYIVGSRGSVGSSLVAFFMGITEVNALPPHYYCSKCHFIAIKLNKEEKKKYSPFLKAEEFEEILQKVGTGYDLPLADCPLCGHSLSSDGVDIPFETFLGIKGDKVPDIDLNFSGEYQSRAHDFCRELFGDNHAFRAGTISTIAEKTAWGFAKGYLERQGIQARNCEVARLANKITGVKRSTGQHPGGIVIIPKEIEYSDIIPVQYPADDLSSSWRTTHYDYHKFEANLLKMDILGHDDPTMIWQLMSYVEKMADKFPFTTVEEIPLADKKVLALFSGLSSLGVNAADVHEVIGTTGLPEFGTPLAKEMLREIRPKTVEELIKISGLSHGKDVWSGNARDYMLGVNKEVGPIPFRDLIGCRDDIMVYLLSKGLPAIDAFKIMEDVRKGKGVEPHYEREMLAYNVPNWYIDSCKKIKYMFPKAHAAAYVIMALRIGWFKVYRPIYYYAAYFSRRANAFDIDAMAAGSSAINLKLNELDTKIKNKKAAAKEFEIYNTLLLALEMTMRGFTFQQINIFESSWRDFIITGNSLIIPFRAMDSLGEATAKSITDARDEAMFTSERDILRRTKINTTVFEKLRQIGAFQGLPQDDQIGLF
ncbi:MAG: PolC-type DNA polymerase III, partial [Bacilli bacterium]|nr:PolC-type DNA polymerase III [Bacilli bacterium]